MFIMWTKFCYLSKILKKKILFWAKFCKLVVTGYAHHPNVDRRTDSNRRIYFLPNGEEIQNNQLVNSSASFASIVQNCALMNEMRACLSVCSFFFYFL